MNFAKRILATCALMTVVVQVNASETHELAEASQNPVGNIISLPFEYNYRAYYNAEKPGGAADWAVQLQFKLLFAKG